MRIAVIAANGRLGRAFVKRALSEGHIVRAGVHGDNVFAPHENLEVVVCDATRMEDVKRLITGQDAVVSAIGHVKGSAPDVQTTATKVLIQAMQDLGISRFVDVTGTGVRFPGDKITLIDRFLNMAVGIIDPNRVNDGKVHVKLLQASPLQWTTIRVLKLQDVKERPYALRSGGPTKPYVGRQEVARAMLEVIEHGSFLQEAPIISYTGRE